MAVFPDRIVLKNSTDPAVDIITAIQAGGSDAIAQGEIVLGIEPGNVKFFTRDGNGDIVSLGATSGGSSGVIVSATEPTLDNDGNAVSEGDLWYDTTNSLLKILYQSVWEEVGGGGGVVGAINDLTDVDTATLPPDTTYVLAWNGVEWVPSATLGVVTTGSAGFNETTGDLATYPMAGQASHYADTAALEADGFTYITSSEGADDSARTFTPPARWNGIDFLGNGIQSGGTWFINSNGGVGWDLSGNTTGSLSSNATSVASSIDFYVAAFAQDNRCQRAGFKEHTAEGQDWLVVRVDIKTPYNAPDGNGIPFEAWFGEDGSVSVRYAPKQGTGSDLVPGINRNCIVSNGVAISPSNPFTGLTIAGDYAITFTPGSKFLLGANELGADDLTDVDTTTAPPSVGQALVWDGTNWVPQAQAGESGRGDGGDFNTGIADDPFAFGVYGGGDFDTGAADLPEEQIGGPDGGTF